MTGRLAGLTVKVMTSEVAPGSQPPSTGLRVLLSPGEPRVTTATAASATTTPAARYLPPDPGLGRLGPGRRSSGSPRAAGGGAGAGADGLVREKFMEGLPFVVRQGAEVAVKLEPGGLVLLPLADELVLYAE